MNYSKPSVCVWMCTYQHRDYISQAIEGVLSQQISFPLKLLIADDYSTDGTREICLQYQKKYPDLIELILPSENTKSLVVLEQLFPACFNSGAKYIAMCEGDDFWCDSTKLQKQIDFLERNPDFSGCAHNTELLLTESPGEKSFVVNNIAKNTFTINDFTRGEAYFHTSSMVYRVDKIREIDFEFYKKNPGDSIFLTLMASVGSIGYIDSVMSTYRVHADGVWSKLTNIEQLIKNLSAVIACNKALKYKYEKNYLPLFINNTVNNFKEHDKEILNMISKFPSRDINKIVEYLYRSNDEKLNSTVDLSMKLEETSKLTDELLNTVDTQKSDINKLRVVIRELEKGIADKTLLIEESQCMLINSKVESDFQKQQILELECFKKETISSKGWKFVIIFRKIRFFLKNLI